MALVLALVSAVLQHVQAGRTTLGDPPAVYNVVLPRASSSPLHVHVAVRNTHPVYLMLKTDDEPAPPATCAAELDAYCANESDPELTSCYALMRATHRRIPMVAAFSGDIKHAEQIWRCYSPTDIRNWTPGMPLMQRQFFNHNNSCTAPDCCCTAPALRTILHQCDPGWEPPPPPPTDNETGIPIFAPESKPRTPGEPFWSHYGNAVSLLFVSTSLNETSFSEREHTLLNGHRGVLIALTLASGTVSRGGNSSFPVEVPVIRRSSDGGISWGEQIFPLGRPRPGDRWLPMQQLYDTTSQTLLLTLGNGTTPIPRALTCESHGIIQLSSTDQGLHWHEDGSISAQLSGETTCLAPTGGVGLQLREGSPWAGRLLWAMTQNAYQGDVVVWSDRGGRSYNHSDSLHIAGLDEWQMVELANHSILAILRNCADAAGNIHKCHMATSHEMQGGGGGGARVAVAMSTDGGMTFSHPRLHTQLVTPIWCVVVHTSQCDRRIA